MMPKPPCTRRDELRQVLRAGQWPHGCTPELREHVAACNRCADDARILSAFAATREGAMRLAPVQSPGLLWWKAQIRRRQDALAQFQRPALAISTATIAASLVLLTIVLAAAWKTLDWSRARALFSTAGWSPWAWNPWLIASVATILFGFTLVAILLGLGLPEERR